MTMYFAPVSFLIVSLAALWSQCAWLMSRVLISENLKPSCSTLARMSGTFSSRSLLIRMCSYEVVIR
jgi:hypothetical protein